MKTERLAVDPANLNTPEARKALARAAEILRNGGLVALPTETVYGLGANALDAAAVARIFAAKQRPAWDPVIVHIAGTVRDNPMLEHLVTDLPDAARRLMDAFWPGPLTLLLPRSAAVPDAVTAGRPLVGIRMPAHPVAFELIQLAGVPVAAPSANLFSQTSPTSAPHVLQDLDGRIDAVLDAGAAVHGVESTVLDPSQEPMVIYRPGAITLEQIRAVGGETLLFKTNVAPEPNAPGALPSPGVGIRHYAPKARLILVEGTLPELRQKISAAVAAHTGERVGVMLPAELNGTVPDGVAVFQWGRWAAPEELAHGLYAGLRALDAQGCEVIVCPVPEADGIGTAIRDRLRKAAWSGSGLHAAPASAEEPAE